MNCRHLKTIMSNKVNLKSMSSFKQAKPEQLYCCFNKDPNETVRSVKFVPKQEPLRVPVEKYHESNSQAIIYNRMANLHKTYKMGGAESQILSKGLQNLMNSGQRSFTNLPTKRNVKSRNSKSLSRQRSGSSSSTARNSFARNNPSHYALIRPAITGRSLTIPKRNFTPHNGKIKKDKLTPFTGAKKAASREKHDKAEFKSEDKDDEEAATDSLEIALNIRDQLEDLSSRIKDDLMSIDGSLKERLNIMKNRPSKQQTMTFGAYSDDYGTAPYQEKLNLNLMPIQREPSSLSQFTEHSKSLQSGEEESIYKSHLPTETRPITTTTDDRWFDFKLMEVNKAKPHFPSLQENNPGRHIIQITTKDAADAEGIYYAPQYTV